MSGASDQAVRDANALWRNDAPQLWEDIQAPRWHASRTAWLLTCVDLTSLLVGFFVLMFSTQSLQEDLWEELTGGFQARFAPDAPVVGMLPDGADNALVRTVTARSGLAYLDTLLRQRMQSDGLWAGLVARDTPQELLYELSDTMTAADGDAWARLGGAMRGWKNPVGIRVTATQAQANEAAQKAVALAGKLSNSGLMGVFADVKIQDGVPGTAVQIVVRAR